MSNCSRQTLPSEIKPLIFTENAANKVAELIAEEGDNNLKLRVYIEGGGCSGFKYGFTLDDIIQPDDEKYVTNGVTLLVNKEHARYLSNAKIDYIEDIAGERFTIENPNAAKTCSCGSSFDV